MEKVKHIKDLQTQNFVLKQTVVKENRELQK